MNYFNLPYSGRIPDRMIDPLVPLEIVLSDNLDWLKRRATESVDLIYIDPPFMTQKKFKSYDDRWKSRTDFTVALYDRVVQARRILKPTGNFVCHLDPRMAPYMRIVFDGLFDDDNFHNEIIWSYNSGGAGKRELAKKHDTLLWYSKTNDYTFNILREPYATPNVKGRAGFNDEGRMLTDVWSMSIISTTAKERVGYDSQKPLALLRRVIECFSNPGDAVCDFYCGSGTTGVAALELGRRAILVDENPEAIRIAEERCCNVRA